MMDIYILLGSDVCGTVLCEMSQYSPPSGLLNSLADYCPCCLTFWEQGSSPSPSQAQVALCCPYPSLSLDNTLTDTP